MPLSVDVSGSVPVTPYDTYSTFVHELTLARSNRQWHLSSTYSKTWRRATIDSSKTFLHLFFFTENPFSTDAFPCGNINIFLMNSYNSTKPNSNQYVPNKKHPVWTIRISAYFRTMSSRRKK